MLTAFIAIIITLTILSIVLADVLCDFTHGSCCPPLPDSVTIADYVTVLPAMSVTKRLMDVKL